MHFLLFADACADHLGRVSLAAFDQQTLLELLVGARRMSTATRRSIKTETGDFQDISKWYMNNFNEKGEVVEMHWGTKGMHGTFDMQYVPKTVKTLYIADNRLSGTIDWTSLPDELFNLSLHWNKFTGTVDCGALPPMLELFNIHTNRLSGTIDLSKMPAIIHTIDLASNRFTGVLDLDCLPKEARVSHNDNKFSEVRGVREPAQRFYP